VSHSDGMQGAMSSRSIVLCVMVFLQASCAANPPDSAQSTLTNLARHFRAARALPEGTRPAPPDVKIEKIVGLPVSAVRSALGPADAPLKVEYDWDCDAETCQIYTYGADERASIDARIAADKKDLESIVITTGGPYVLVVGVSSNTVATARWQGQK
jgi:hypothetical protein